MNSNATTDRGLLLSVYAPTLMLSFSQAVLVPTLPLYAQSFGISLAQVSLAVAAAGFGTLLMDLPAGLLLERMGRRPMMLAGTGALALATLAIPLVPLFPVLVLARLIAGAGTAMWNISRMAYLTDVTSPRDRGRAISTFGGVNRIGTFVGPAVGGLVGSIFGLAAPFVVSGVLAALALLLAYLFIIETGRREGAAHGKLRWRVMGEVVRRHWRDLSAAGAAQVFAQMIRAGRQLIVPLYGANMLGLDVAAVGSIVSISAAIDMSLFVPAGFIMDRLGRKFASVPSFLVMGLGMALIPFARDYTGLLVATAVIGLGNGLGSGTMMTLGADLAPRQAVGEFLGVWRLIGDAGSTGGPVVVGAIADLVGLSMAALVLAGVGGIAAATLALFVRETLEEHAPAAEQAPSPTLPGSGEGAVERVASRRG
jgi:MFS family permease